MLQLKCFEHNDKSLEKPLLLGNTEGIQNGPRRRRQNDINMSLQKLKDVVTDRPTWMNYVHCITKVWKN